MSSFQQIDDLVFDEINQQEPLVDLHDHVPMDGNITHQANKQARRKHHDGSLTNPSSSTVSGVGDDQTNKKLNHREIEMQRRKQMANLYASLRSLLPLEYIKGKRTIPDQIDQTVNYIKHMQENIKGLGVKRDQLMDFMGTMSMNTNESLNNLLSNTVIVNICNEGIEILINSCSIQDGFLLSRVLKTLVGEGLNIISCTSTRANNRILHTIQTEVRFL
ncbi:putative transcription factor bHLH family [Helianthus debilis subsp. tardiflorus]